MATIHPFRVLRPEPDVAAAVAAVPYDVVNTAEARALADANRLSFLRVSRPEIELPDGTDPYSDVVYAAAVRNFARLRAAAPLVQEAVASLYIYRLRMGTHEQTGIAGCFSVDEYATDVIRKHEKTRKDKEDDRTRHILETRAQTGPVFLTYPASDAVDTVVARTVAGSPLFDFTAVDSSPYAPKSTSVVATSQMVCWTASAAVKSNSGDPATAGATTVSTASLAG